MGSFTHSLDNGEPLPGREENEIMSLHSSTKCFSYATPEGLYGTTFPGEPPFSQEPFLSDGSLAGWGGFGMVCSDMEIEGPWVCSPWGPFISDVITTGLPWVEPDHYGADDRDNCARESTSNYAPSAYDSNCYIRCEMCGEQDSGLYRREDLVRHRRKSYVDGMMNVHKNWGYALKRWAWFCGSTLSALGASTTMRNRSGNWTNHEFLPISDTAIDVACLAGFGLCTAMLHSNDALNQHKDAWLIGGVILGTVAGISTGYDLRESLVQVVPWVILASMVLSSIVHLAIERVH